jgi:hypothetical protein
LIYYSKWTDNENVRFKSREKIGHGASNVGQWVVIENVTGILLYRRPEIAILGGNVITGAQDTQMASNSEFMKIGGNSI